MKAASSVNMAPTGFYSYYSACFLLVFLVVLSHPQSTAVENSTAVPTRHPPPLDVDPASLVRYNCKSSNWGSRQQWNAGIALESLFHKTVTIR